MSAKSFIMIGMVVGSTIGGFLPELWGGGIFSFSSVILTFIGGAIGIWAGYKISRNFTS